MDKKLERVIINKYMDMRKLIESHGHWVAPNGTHFCIFHKNDNTKAAKYYENDGGGQVFCFAEYRQYTPYDYYTILHPEIDVTELAQALFDRLSEADQKNIKQSVYSENEYDELPYLKHLEDFKEGKCTYPQLMSRVKESFPDDEIMQMVNKLYSLPHVPKFNNDNKYFYYMNNYETTYKLVSSYMVLRQVQDLPDFVRQHLESVGDCILIPNIIDNQVMSITFRSVNSDKRFLKYGEFSSLLYGLGSLPSEFKYGTPIIITEGNLDCDYFKTIYPCVLASLTATLTNNHIKILQHLTNRVILAFDNDESGAKGYYSSLKRLKGIKVTKFDHNTSLKDFGDLLSYQWQGNSLYDLIHKSYKSKIFLLVE